MASVTLLEAMQAINSRFKTQWEAEPRTETFILEGEPHPTAGAAFARLSVRHQTSQQRTMAEPGNRRMRRPGLILIQCFAPTGDGMTLARTMAQVARGIFEGVSFSSIECEVGTTREMDDDGTYVGMIAEIPFDYDEFL